MGEASRRGTYEQRVAMAIERDKLIREKLKDKLKQQTDRNNEQPTGYGAFLTALLAVSASSVTGSKHSGRLGVKIPDSMIKLNKWV